MPDSHEGCRKMTNTDMGACEQFVSELRRSNLVDRGQLDSVLDEFFRRNPYSEPEALADRLVSQNLLTRFQADRVQQGKTAGLVLGPYVLTDAIGSGSMGTVHKGQSKEDNKWYAIKILPRRSMWNVRLARRQVKSFGQFSHPAIVPFVDVGTAGGSHYLAWPFVEGETLESLVGRLGQLNAPAVAYVGHQVAAGLALAHQNGLFHGQLKPSNIMVSANGAVRILDFGIGSLLAENEGESLVDTMSTANTLTSGLDCASPESIMEPTNRTCAGDQYSLGCILYWCLAGQYPFAEGSAVEKMMAHQFKEPPPLGELVADVSPALVEIIERLMKKKPDDRYIGVDQAAEALEHLAPAQPTVALFDSSAQALTMTPAPMLTKANIGPTRPPSAEIVRTRPVAPPVVAESPAFSPAVVPSAKPASAPALAQAFPQQPQLDTVSLSTSKSPTHKSLRGFLAAQTASEQSKPWPAANDPNPVVQEVAGAQPSESLFAGPRPAFGLLGFLALGATFAIACFLVVHNLVR
jgi:serine/threonine protein kinase